MDLQAKIEEFLIDFRFAFFEIFEAVRANAAAAYCLGTASLVATSVLSLIVLVPLQMRIWERGQAETVRVRRYEAQLLEATQILEQSRQAMMLSRPDADRPGAPTTPARAQSAPTDSQTMSEEEISARALSLFEQLVADSSLPANATAVLADGRAQEILEVAGVGLTDDQRRRLGFDAGGLPSLLDAESNRRRMDAFRQNWEEAVGDNQGDVSSATAGDSVDPSLGQEVLNTTLQRLQNSAERANQAAGPRQTQSAQLVLTEDLMRDVLTADQQQELTTLVNGIQMARNAPENTMEN